MNNNERMDKAIAIPFEGLIEEWLKNELTVHEVDTAYGRISVKQILTCPRYLRGSLKKPQHAKLTLPTCSFRGRACKRS